MHRRSYGSVEVYWLDKEGLISALEKKAQGALECFPELRKVVLFGSLARGEATPRSDADLLFVVEEAGPFLERTARYLPFFEDLGFPVDSLVYAEPERVFHDSKNTTAAGLGCGGKRFVVIAA